MQVGMHYDLENSSVFYKTLLTEKFIEEESAVWVPNGHIFSKLAKIEIAGEDYSEGDKKYFTWDEAMAIEKKLNNGWRLPTRSEWTLICEEFGQKKGTLDTKTLMDNLSLHNSGYVGSGSLSLAGPYGYYWSSTVFNSDSAYSLYFDSSNVYPSANVYRGLGFSVRLVRDLEDKAC